MKKPETTVVLSVYNGEKYLGDAIESILRQTYANFEFIIIDDGSIDGTHKILRSYRDSRIRLIHHFEKKGLAASLNEGIAIAQGTYIARMDADDISMPKRLEKQIAFLRKNKKVGVVGSHMYLINEKGAMTGTAKKFLPDFAIRWACLFSSPLHHPTVVMRKKIAVENPYHEHLSHSQDYELWSRLMGKTKFANINSYFLKYRIHKNSASGAKTQMQNEKASEIAIRNIKKYVSLNADEEKLIKNMRVARIDAMAQIRALQQLHQKICNAYARKERLTAAEIKIIKTHMRRLYFTSWKWYFKSKLSALISSSAPQSKT